MSRRGVVGRVVQLGAAGAAGATLPLLGASAAPAGPSGFTGGLGRVFDVTEYGARADGVTIDSPAINRAIDAAAVSGGTVYLPAGTYASYSIRLRDNIALYIAHGARLLAAKPAGGEGYDPAEPGPGNEYQDFGHNHWHNSLIWGEGLTNVTIHGTGTIDGAGLAVASPDEEVPLQGNKTIALKRCRNVIIRDLTIVDAGHFAILPTGVDNLRIDGLVIDTNRDGINIDCCRNVRISNTTVNAPADDAIVLKSSYGLGEARATENVTIDNCMVSGYDRGTLVDGTFKTGDYGRVGRIKFGTESNGGFKNIAISNVIFEHCRGLALETVDGGLLEDVTISNLTMRHVQMPFFLRLGARMRGPAGVPVGALRRVNISDVVAHDCDPRLPSLIAGIPGHRIEDVRISNVRQHVRGGLTMNDAVADPPELIDSYPEVDNFGTLPAYGFFVRHAKGLTLDNVEVRYGREDRRPAYVLRDVVDADVHHNRADKAEGVPTFVLDAVDGFLLSASRPVADQRLGLVAHQEL
jgi:polygalacturonase